MTSRPPRSTSGGRVLRPAVPGVARSSPMRDRGRAARRTLPPPSRTCPGAPAAAGRRSRRGAAASSRRRARPRRPPSPCSASPRCRWSRASARYRRAPRAPAPTAMPSTSCATCGKRRLHALPVGVHAAAHLEAAVRRQAHDRLLAAGHHRDAPAGIDRRAVRAPARRRSESPKPMRRPSGSPWRWRARTAARSIVVDAHGAAPADNRRCRNASAVMLSKGICVGRHQIAQADLVRLEAGLARRSRPSPSRSRSTRRCGPRRDRAGSAACWWRPTRCGSDSADIVGARQNAARPARLPGRRRTDRMNRRRNRRSLRSRSPSNRPSRSA